MVISIFAALLTLAGAGTFVTSSLFYGYFFSDFLFDAGVICFSLGPLIFLAYVLVGLWLEFYVINDVPAAVTVSPARYAPETPLYSLGLAGLPEGLRRERKGPLNRGTGRAGSA